ncbi:hypothetical protein IAT38_005593 [Cryptococcus sp. DSM 104549]
MPRPAQPSSGLGIEDELSFGSDEDLLADVGEIDLTPATMPPTAGKPEKKSGSRFKLSSSKKKPEESHGAEKERERREKKDTRHLSKAALVLEPQMESVLDLTSQGGYSRSSGSASGSTPSLPGLPAGALSSSGTQKRRGLRGALKGLGMKKEDPVAVFGGQRALGGRASEKKLSDKLYAVRSIESYTTADLSPQQSIDLSLSSYSSRRTEYTASSVHTHHLAPIPTSPFKAHRPGSLTDNSTIASKHTSVSSFAHRASISTSIGTTHNGTASPVPSHKDKSILGKFPDAPLDRQISPKATPHRPSLTTTPTYASADSDAALLAVLLPSFPATLSALENIQILSATVIRRTLPAFAEKESRGLRGFGLGGASGSPGQGGKRRAAWTTQQIVLTSVKIGGSTPPESPALGGPGLAEPSSARTIAHLHLFSVPAPPASPIKATSGDASASASPVKASSAGQVELERMVIKAASTAGVWDESMSGDGSGGGDAKRKFMMRVGYGAGGEGEGGDSEWVVEMRNAEQLQEWIRQIKSIATLVRAEQEGHGEAIRSAYNTGTIHGDALALALNIERGNPPSATRGRSPEKAPSRSSTGGTGPGAADFPQPPTGSTSTLSPFPASSGMERGSSGLSGTTARSAVSAARAESPDMFGQGGEPEAGDEDLRGRLERFDMSSTPVPPRRESEVSPSPARRTPVPEAEGSHGRKHSLPLSFTNKAPTPPPSAPPTAPLPALPAHAGLSEAEMVRLRANEQRAAAPAPGQGPLLAPEVSHRPGASGESEQTTPTTTYTGTVPTPLLAPDAQSLRSIPSVSSTPSTTASRRRKDRKMMAVDIMAEFNESGAADYEVEGEDELVQDRPRVIRFA